MNESTFTNGELAVIAIANLGGRTNPVDLEDIAIELFKIAPQKFSLKKYPNHVDIHIVRVSISHMALDKTPPFISGSIRTGYMLSPYGIKWIDEFGDIPPELLSGGYRRGSELHSLDFEVRRIKKTEAYKNIVEGELDKLTTNSFREFLRINEYFTRKKVINRINIINNASELDEKVKAVWEVLKEKFKDELSKFE